MDERHRTWVARYVISPGAMWQLFAVSAVVMGLSYTIAHERLFQRFRQRCGGRDTFVGYLVTCPYCLSHWIAFVVVPLTGTYPLHMAARIPFVSPVVDWFLSSILVTAIAAFLRVLFFFVDETQGLVRRRKKIEEEHLEQTRDEDRYVQ
jgi:hypothetical protein